jgi:4-oxalocrotonate tautomerase
VSSFLEESTRRDAESQRSPLRRPGVVGTPPATREGAGDLATAGDVRRRLRLLCLMTPCHPGGRRMPLQRIDLVAGRSAGARRAIADAVHRALVEAVGVPEKDRFQIVSEHRPGEMIVAPEYLGVTHENPVLVQVTLNAGRSLEQKQRLYARMAELVEAAGVRRGDLIVNLVEVAKEDWSFGDGVAQYAPAAPPAR